MSSYSDLYGYEDGEGGYRLIGRLFLQGEGYIGGGGFLSNAILSSLSYEA